MYRILTCFLLSLCQYLLHIYVFPDEYGNCVKWAQSYQHFIQELPMWYRRVSKFGTTSYYVSKIEYPSKMMKKLPTKTFSFIGTISCFISHPSIKGQNLFSKFHCLSDSISRHSFVSACGGLFSL